MKSTSTVIGSLVLGLAISMSGVVHTQTNTPMLAKVRSMYPATQVQDVVNTPLQGVYEIRMGRNVAFTDSSARYLIFGAMFDSATQEVLTKSNTESASHAENAPLAFPREHLQYALRTVRGNGSRVMAVFSDPRCGYCRQLESELAQLNDVTIYTFMYAALGEASQQIAADVWCSEKPLASWSSAIQTGKVKSSKPCDHPTQHSLALGARLGVQGTPTMIALSGATLAGYRSAREIDAWLGSASSAAMNKGHQP
jgi:thiol:disulfide interchange protein DsbC